MKKQDVPATRGDIDDVLSVLQTFMKQVDDRFLGIDKQLMATDIKLSRIETMQDQQDELLHQMNDKYDHLINTIDGFVGRIDRYETELAARDHKIERLEHWIKEIATSTGVKLSV